ncbi:hypothetical protein VQ045_04030 [Aurantimonas sp. E1-2-R+4]
MPQNRHIVGAVERVAYPLNHQHRVTGEKLRPGDDHEDQADREGDTAEQTREPEQAIIARAGYKVEDRAEGNVEARQYR